MSVYEIARFIAASPAVKGLRAAYQEQFLIDQSLRVAKHLMDEACSAEVEVVDVVMEFLANESASVTAVQHDVVQWAARRAADAAKRTAGWSESIAERLKHHAEQERILLTDPPESDPDSSEGGGHAVGEEIQSDVQPPLAEATAPVEVKIEDPSDVNVDIKTLPVVEEVHVVPVSETTTPASEEPSTAIVSDASPDVATKDLLSEVAVGDLKIKLPLKKALVAAGLVTVRDVLNKHNAVRLESLPGIGPQTQAEILEAIAKIGG